MTDYDRDLAELIANAISDRIEVVKSDFDFAEMMNHLTLNEIVLFFVDGEIIYGVRQNVIRKMAISAAQDTQEGKRTFRQVIEEIDQYADRLSALDIIFGDRQQYEVQLGSLRRERVAEITKMLARMHLMKSVRALEAAYL
jgi:hypothetical protein